MEFLWPCLAWHCKALACPVACVWRLLVLSCNGMAGNVAGILVRIMNIFKKLLIFVCCLYSTAAYCQDDEDHVPVKAYTKKDGTYVEEHYRTKPEICFISASEARANGCRISLR